MLFRFTFLSGISDDMRAVGGRLEASARVAGTVGAPQIAGKLGWREGRLLLAGLGEYEGIDLALHGDTQQMVLDHLIAHSGEGSANLSGHAVRGSDGRQLTVDARADVTRFRLYTEGQPLGAISLRATAHGTVESNKIEIATKKIGRASCRERV